MSNIDKIRKRLVERKQELEAAISRIYTEKMVEDSIKDTGDQALSSILEDLKVSLHNNESEEYKRVLKAIEMIDQGKYGVCVDCGNPISEKRLKIFPDSNRCLLCQESLEEKGQE